ncbi:BrnA antitoxin family protein [Francisella philomiragia]|uniref:BrnA antitoxin family protein n=1 Tax=Francisella philomiragia TaxID=28110 RepID=UPI001905DFD0|nr:BrnA antitoxin family protein [Francisella philomiragia]MBK2257597.1 BrnA antitoxin family protein [Francisella philomiragia]MBK2270309.1 BrnA antitoxin family protein [Francisella philomiragia]MBK2272139.1 BrnA antitoxin family protein [Francisella philomiragia]MBK2275975.1 BrnA antitoxin family protein [Francisella philomiragia]MBK2295510.1 BrnA antitoxin family protein [Francisella philomiragia]
MNEKQKNIMKQLESLDKIENKDIDYSDSQDMSDVDFSSFEVFKKEKKQVTLRIDKDVLDFFKKMGKGYQTKINEVLKEYKKQKAH